MLLPLFCRALRNNVIIILLILQMRTLRLINVKQLNLYAASLKLVNPSLKTPRVSLRRRQWHPTPVLLPGKSHGWRSLVGCSPWGRYVGHDWATSLSLFTSMHWRRKWQPTPVFLPGESQGQGSLVGCSLWGCTVGHDWSDLAAAAAARYLATIRNK